MTLPQDLHLSCTSGKTFSMTTLQGCWTVLYFYPKDATPGCTIEGRDFAALYPAFTSLGAQIFGVSRDSLASHEKFCTKQQFPFDLVSDPDAILCRAFEVFKEKSLFGKIGLGIERSTFLLNPEGAVVKAWRKVKVAGHAEAVLQALREASVRAADDTLLNRQ
ncbi:MAG: peroxiredoxin [Cardiobacteriaceae bacterium]|nr:peroxiredoxin [Cardiobacteriaceae bacterium]